MFRCMLTVVGFLSGCAHYSVGSAPNTVAVNTVSTPPHLHLSEGNLTRRFVDDLRTRGYDATWSQSAEIVLVCRIEASSAFETDDAALHDWMGTCEWDGAEGLNTIEATTASVGKTAGADISALGDRTATVLLADLAFQFDRKIRGTP